MCRYQCSNQCSHGCAVLLHTRAYSRARIFAKKIISHRFAETMQILFTSLFVRRSFRQVYIVQAILNTISDDCEENDNRETLLRRIALHALTCLYIGWQRYPRGNGSEGLDGCRRGKILARRHAGFPASTRTPV